MHSHIIARQIRIHLPANVFTGHLKNLAMIADITTPPKVGGIALAASTHSWSLGMPKRTKIMVNRAHPYVAIPSWLRKEKYLPFADWKWVNCALSITNDNPFTKPTITGWGTIRISLPMPAEPAMIWISPARVAHPAKYPLPSIESREKWLWINDHRCDTESIDSEIENSRDAHSDATTTVHAPDAELHIPALPKEIKCRIVFQWCH